MRLVAGRKHLSMAQGIRERQRWGNGLPSLTDMIKGPDSGMILARLFILSREMKLAINQLGVVGCLKERKNSRKRQTGF
jgi:hypothetical protein